MTTLPFDYYRTPWRDSTYLQILLARASKNPPIKWDNLPALVSAYILHQNGMNEEHLRRTSPTILSQAQPSPGQRLMWSRMICHWKSHISRSYSQSHTGNAWKARGTRLALRYPHYSIIVSASNGHMQGTQLPIPFFSMSLGSHSSVNIGGTTGTAVQPGVEVAWAASFYLVQRYEVHRRSRYRRHRYVDS
jgi:hypothetical protein